MTAEILIAIAMLCQIGFGTSIRYYITDVQNAQLACQKQYIDCIKLKTEKVDQLGKALANCVKEK